MYVRMREGLRQAVPANPVAGARQSDGWRLAVPIHPSFGQAASSVPACIPTPRWLTLLQHFFVPKSPLITSRSPFRGRWEPAPLHGVLQPDKLNPGYIDSVTHALRLDPSLDPKLKALMADVFAGKSLFDREPYKKFVSNRGKIRVALVDLSTDEKYLFPTVTEYDSAKVTYGASLAKIGALYGAHQLRFDLNIQARTNPQSMTADRIRKLKTIFDVTHVGQPPVASLEFNRDFLRALNEICENWAAKKIITAVGFRYLASALWQSGLYDC